MAYVVMAYIVRAHIVRAYVVMAVTKVALRALDLSKNETRGRNPDTSASETDYATPTDPKPRPSNADMLIVMTDMCQPACYLIRNDTHHP